MVQADRKPYILNPEKVAYWYLRLNGFLQIEDFYVHPGGKGGARTDADLLAVRFPYRAERLYDDPNDIMEDDDKRLALTTSYIDVVIAEVKTGLCALNGPWTDPYKNNVHRVLAAIGCLPMAQIEDAAEAIYDSGAYIYEPSLENKEKQFSVRIRLLSIGQHINTEQSKEYPDVLQIVWRDILGFIFDRFQKYRHQKKQTDHWDCVGKRLKNEATCPRVNREAVIDEQLLAIRRYAEKGDGKRKP